MKKGFTLIELLGTLVILAILAIITIPLITRVIDLSRKRASSISCTSYVSNLQSYIELRDIKSSSNLNDGVYQLSEIEYELDEDITDIKQNEIINELIENSELKIKGKYPDIGYVIVRNKRVISGYMIVMGYGVYFNVDDSGKVTTSVGNKIGSDVTPPRINIDSHISRRNSTIINYNVVEEESEIESITCKYGTVEGQYNNIGRVVNNTCVMTNLEANTNYYYEITVKNTEGGEKTKKGVISTGSTDIEYSLTNPSTWKTSKEATITFKSSVTNPVYYVKTSVDTTSNQEGYICSGESSPENCTNETTTSYVAGTWYKVNGSLKLTFTTPGMIYAMVHDGDTYTSSITENIDYIDSTRPELELGNINKTTTRVIIPFNVNRDLDSYILNTECLYGENYELSGVVNEDKTACTITSLTPNTTYNYKIITTNASGLSVEETDSVTTGSTSIGYSLTNGSDWKKSKTAALTFTTSNVTTPVYYVKTSVDTTSTVSGIACGTNTDPSDCSGNGTTSYTKNTWYKVEGNPNITFNENGTIYALIYDGDKYSASITENVDYIDNTPPTCGTATGGKSNWTTDQNVTVGVTCSDTYGECSKSEFTETISGNGQTEEVTITISDKAGNTNTCTNTYNKYIDTVAPTTPTAGSIGAVSGSSTTGSIQTEASGSTDTGGSGEISYLYLVTNSNSTPANTNTSFTTSRNFTRSCGTSYYGWAIAVDKVGNRSAVKSLGSTSDGADSYSEWGACSASCGGGTQTKTNTCALKQTLSQSCNTQACCDTNNGTRYKVGVPSNGCDGSDSFAGAGGSARRPVLKYTFSGGSVTKKEVCGYVNSKYICLTYGSSYYSANEATLKGLGVSCSSDSSGLSCPGSGYPYGGAYRSGFVSILASDGVTCCVWSTGSGYCQG